MPDLKDLANKRKDILLAELAAWLHDVGKCSDSFFHQDGMGFKAPSCQNRPRVNPHKAVFSPKELQNLPYWTKLSKNRGQCARLDEARHNTALWKTFSSLQVSIPAENILLKNNSINLREIILWGRPLVSDNYINFTRVLGNSLTYLSGILGKAHQCAHMEKEDEADGGQSSGYSSPFGFYIGDFKNLNHKLKEIIKHSHNFYKNRKNFVQTIHKNGQKAPGDTRRPINEVTLWDWSSIVAALYKAEVARCVLKNEQRNPQDIQWRLFSIRTNGLAYLLSANSIPDLLARKNLLTDAWNRVQDLLEETYPLGLEVYRDENGPVFVVPDIENLLDLTDSSHNGKTLREFILEEFSQGTVQNDPSLAFQGEVVPQIHLDCQPWKGQPAHKELPPIREHLRKTPPLQSDPHWMLSQWCHLSKPRERCHVCGLRPQGPSSEALNRKMCDVCEKRRSDRAKAWGYAKLHTTIWLDEVADENGRIALILGTFDLTHWLDGTLVRTLAVRNPEKAPDKTKTEDIAKNPSFARLRRIWETTKRFWEEILEKEAKDLVGTRSRIFLRGTPSHPADLAPYHAYELVMRDRKVAVLWVPPNEKDDQNKPLKYRGGFWVIENLEYLDKVYGKPFRQMVEELSKEKYALQVYEPTEYGRPGQPRTTFTLSEIIEPEDAPYTPLIPILAEPRTFMALVPATRALDIVKAIKAKYEREMGKVRNRLPLHLGIIFSDAHQPLRTILDAGRRMLRYSGNKKDVWTVKEVRYVKKKDIPKALTQGTKQFDNTILVTLEREGRTITWYVPAVMGDGQTEDLWYPYVFWKQDQNGKTDPGQATQKRDRYYQAPNPFDLDCNRKPQPPWLVHAGELQAGDKVYFTFATFDFEFMDYNVRRFDIYYEGEKRKGSFTKPYLLDEIEELERIWNYLQGDESKPRITNTQIMAIRKIIERKRFEWFDDPEESLTDNRFKSFCSSVFKNAKWQIEKPDQEKLKWLTDMAVRGYFNDAVNLFHHILKKKITEG